MILAFPGAALPVSSASSRAAARPAAASPALASGQDTFTASGPALTSWMRTIAARTEGARWTPEQANQWYARQPLPVGCNFIPSTAINQLEMWQPETFDPKTIDKELGLAQSLGMNTVRVFLHNLLWESDADGFKQRINQYLEIADKHHIKTMFVLFDTCWNDDPKLGQQPAPRPGVHNSGWVQAPGSDRMEDPSSWVGLEGYVKDILTTYSKDSRVLAWDLFNEPSNGGYGDKVMPLLRKSFEWGKQANPEQPLTAGRWNEHEPSNEFMLNNSDIITFHNYESAGQLQDRVEDLQDYGRPMICTEYMARPVGSTFQTCLPVLEQHHVGALNWGLVKGKTNTIFQWGQPLPQLDEPPVWFHDIFRPDGTPFSAEEVEFLKKQTAHLAR